MLRSHVLPPVRGIPDRGPGPLRAEARGAPCLRRPHPERDVPEAEQQRERPQGGEGGRLPPARLGLRAGGQDAADARGGMACHKGRRILRPFRLRKDAVLLLQGRAPGRDTARGPSAQKGLEDAAEMEDVHRQKGQRDAGLGASGGDRIAEDVRTLGGRPRRRPEGRDKRRVPDPGRAEDAVPCQDTGQEQEGVGRPLGPCLLQGLPSVLREEVPQRDVRQRVGVLSLEGEGAAALGQDLLRTSLPFRGQRKQRELQRADTKIREEGNGHREDRPERDGEDQPEDQRQAERNPRLGKRGVFLREHALEGRDTCGGHVPP